MTNSPSNKEYKDYRIDVKKRLNAPFRVRNHRYDKKSTADYLPTNVKNLVHPSLSFFAML